MLKKLGEYAAVLTAIGTRAQVAMPVVVPSKNARRFGLAELKRSVIEAGSTTVYLQSDRGSSVKAWVGAITKESPGFRCRKAPTGSSAGQGSVERSSQTLFAHIRVLRLFLAPELQAPTGSLTAKHPYLHW